jgi:ketosteroid isomerase-like protein
LPQHPAVAYLFLVRSKLALLANTKQPKKVKPMNAISDLVRKYFAAYDSKDRKSLEGLLRDDFTFSSPLDDNISREQYLERCWPNSEHQSGFHIKKLFADGDEAFVTYECEKMDGNRFRNTEFFTSDGEKFTHVDVYFGMETGKSDKP